MTSFRLMLALTAALKLELHSMDVATAYLQTPLTRATYARLPKGMAYKTWDPGKHGHLLVRVNRALYGLAQSGRLWNQEIDAWLRSYGLKPSKADPCLYVKGSLNDKEGLLMVGLYVDDLPIAASKVDTLQRFKAAISSKFIMKDLGELTGMLGMEIKRDRAAGTIEISQKRYLAEIAERFGMSQCKPADTPMSEVVPRGDPQAGAKPDGYFLALIGCLLYLAMVSRPDVALAVQVLARSSHATGPEHILAAKRVLKYLMGTANLTLKYGQTDSNTDLTGYCDADFAGDVQTRKSTSAYVFMIGGGAVSWASRLQSLVALSTAESEYVSACSATQETVHLRQLLEDVGFKQHGPTPLMEDNQACIAFSTGAGDHNRTKHIEVRYHFVRDKVAKGEVKLIHVSTEHQLADLLTKPLDKIKHERLRMQVLGHVRSEH